MKVMLQYEYISTAREMKFLSEITSFAPVVDQNSHLLILGSMPGVESLNKSEYYGNPRNQFWKIIYQIFETELQSTYHQKLQFLISKGIALWDVIESCEREGSLDSNIRNEIPNDFASFFSKYPNICYVVFNGAKAFDTYKKHIGFDVHQGIVYKQLPSTSPANTQKLDQKLKAWSVLREFTEQGSSHEIFS